jgi:xanthine dehydrogenase accessory factor
MTPSFAVRSKAAPMLAVDHEVLARVRAWLDAGAAVHLCTIAHTYGSSPRPVGSLLAVGPAGETVGSLSGGCVEDDLVAALRAGEIARDRPELLRYGLSADDRTRLGLPCGGSLQVVVEPIAPTAPARAVFASITDALDARDCITRRVALDRPGAMEIVPTEHGFQLDENDPTRPVLRHTYGPRWHLFVIGAGMVSRYLSEMAQALDFQVSICDPRPEMLERWTLPGVTTHCAMPDDAVRAFADDPRTAIVALTHDPRIDDMGMMEALETKAFYVGAMGSTRTSASRRERLAALDLSDASIDRLHAPVGLPIGSKTPPEIAIAILAELVAERRRVDMPAAHAADS